MTVAELIVALSAFPPETELWEVNPYATGARLVSRVPELTTIHLDPSGRRKPRFFRSLCFERNREAWSVEREVVEL